MCVSVSLYVCVCVSAYMSVLSFSCVCESMWVLDCVSACVCVCLYMSVCVCLCVSITSLYWPSQGSWQCFLVSTYVHSAVVCARYSPCHIQYSHVACGTVSWCRVTEVTSAYDFMQCVPVHCAAACCSNYLYQDICLGLLMRTPWHALIVLHNHLLICEEV